MGLLAKTNPRATRGSVLRHALTWGVATPLFFLALGKPFIRELWWIFVPVFAILGAGVGALAEWQIDEGPDDPDPDEWKDALDA